MITCSLKVQKEKARFTTLGASAQGVGMSMYAKIGNAGVNASACRAGLMRKLEIQHGSYWRSDSCDSTDLLIPPLVISISF